MVNRPITGIGRATLAAASALALAGCAALGLGACSDGVGPDGTGEPITELPRDLTVAERSVIEGSNDFGLALFGRVVTDDVRPNVVLSPLSASMALGMTMNGSATSSRICGLGSRSWS